MSETLNVTYLATKQKPENMGTILNYGTKVNTTKSANIAVQVPTETVAVAQQEPSLVETRSSCPGFGSQTWPGHLPRVTRTQKSIPVEATNSVLK